MKSRFILVTVLTVLTSAWSAFGQTTGGSRPWTIFVGTSDAVVSNTLTETSIVPTGWNTNWLSANRLNIGDTLEYALSGTLNATSNNASQTANIKLKFGSYVVCNTGAIAIPLVTNAFWDLTAQITCRTNGATGFVVGGGMFRVHNLALNTTNMVFYPLTNIHGLIVGTTTNVPLNATMDYDGAVSWGIGTNVFTVKNCKISLSR